MTLDIWREVEGFPSYMIAPSGEVVNARHREPLKPTMNNTGIVKVSLYRDRLVYTRSLAVLVAREFLDTPPNTSWNTPIHLNGDRWDCRAENLMWRPRWFAIRHHKQFGKEAFEVAHAHVRPIRNLDTGEEYESVREVCVRDGLYFFWVYKSCAMGEPVPFTGHQYAWVEDLDERG